VFFFVFNINIIVLLFQEPDEKEDSGSESDDEEEEESKFEHINNCWQKFGNNFFRVKTNKQISFKFEA
jgi:hypothetical protein